MGVSSWHPELLRKVDMWLVCLIAIRFCLIAIRCICSAEILAAESRQKHKAFSGKHLQHKPNHFKKKQTLTKSNGVSAWLCTVNLGTEGT